MREYHRDLTGQVFGRLTAMQPIIISDRLGRTRRGWVCTCSCTGTDVNALQSALIGGFKKSCGCLHREQAKENLKKAVNGNDVRWKDHWTKADVIGRKFGELVVTGTKLLTKQCSAGSRIYKYTRWECVCSCGRVKHVNNSDLKFGKVQSCGHLSAEKSYQRQINKCKPGEAAFRSLIIQYKLRAKRSGRDFALTEDVVRELFNGRCVYCKRFPSSVHSTQKRRLDGTHKRGNGSFTYNGIDRISSDRGYVSDNVVTCCAECNRMKGSLSLNAFKLHIDTLHENFSNELSAQINETDLHALGAFVSR